MCLLSGRRVVAWLVHARRQPRREPLHISYRVSLGGRAGVRKTAGVVTVDDVRALAITLPRSTEAFVQGRIKFRVGRIVYLAFSRDGTLLGFAFPKEFREALVESEPDRFLLPRQSDLRYNWAVVRLAAIDQREMRELVLDAWAMVVPQKVAAEYARSHADG
jgi:hypothetical protein